VLLSAKRNKLKVAGIKIIKFLLERLANPGDKVA
jgi:hypothetical protein